MIEQLGNFESRRHANCMMMTLIQTWETEITLWNAYAFRRRFLYILKLTIMYYRKIKTVFLWWWMLSILLSAIQIGTQHYRSGCMFYRPKLPWELWTNCCVGGFFGGSLRAQRFRLGVQSHVGPNELINGLGLYTCRI